MGIFQFLCNGVERTSDVLCGRLSSFEDVVQRFVRGVRFDVSHFVEYRFHKDPKRIEDFLLRQLVMLCEAESMLRLRSVFEFYCTKRDFYGQVVYPDALEEYQKRAEQVFCAMRYELDKHLKNPSYFPGFLYAFRNALDDYTSISGMESQEQKYLGFKILEEYSSIKQKVIGLNHEGIKSFYSDYIYAMHKKAFHCFESELELIYNGQIDVYNRRIYDEIIEKSIRDEWWQFRSDVYSSYKREMCSARITDISKDFVKLF